MLTVAEARPAIAKAAQICEDDPRVLEYLNRGVRRLLKKGKWVGTLVAYRICANNDCLTWPRQIQTIELAAVCDKPIKVRNSWYEFNESGPGIQSGTSGLKLVDRGEHCAFDDITGGETDRKIKIYADVAEGSGKYIILQGYDQNGNWIRTQVSGSWIDGERVAIPAAANLQSLSTKYFSKLSRVIKDETNGAIRLYEYNASTSANVRALAIYEPDETLPSYRRSYLPGLSQVRRGSECESATVDVIAKLRFVPVFQENDFLIIGNIDALEEETRALVHFDNKNYPDAYRQEGVAVKLLDEELSAFNGDGPVMVVRVEGNETFGAGAIESL